MARYRRRLTPESKISIYGMVDPDEYKIVYVGSSCNLMGRVTVHINDAKAKRYLANRRTPLHKWIRDVLSKGHKPELCVLEVCIQENRNEREEWWINHLNGINAKLFNIRPVGDRVY